jgi:hypothetical protein
LCSNWKPYLYFNPNFNFFLEILKSFQYVTRKPNLHRSKTRSKFRILLLLLLFFNLLNPSKNLPEIPQSLIVVLSNSNPCYCQVIIIKRKRKKPTNETKNIWIQPIWCMLLTATLGWQITHYEQAWLWKGPLTPLLQLFDIYIMIIDNLMHKQQYLIWYIYI